MNANEETNNRAIGPDPSSTKLYTSVIGNFVKSGAFDYLQVLVTVLVLTFGILLIFLPVKDDEDNPVLKKERWQHVALICSFVVLSVWLILRIVSNKCIDEGTITSCAVVGAIFFVINCYDYVDQPKDEELEFHQKPLFPYTIAVITAPFIAMFLANLFITSRTNMCNEYFEQTQLRQM